MAAKPPDRFNAKVGGKVGGKPVDKPVEKQDIEAKLKEIAGDVEDSVDAAKPYALMAGIGGVVLLILLAYLLGRRKGKKKTTVVEIRRV